MTLARQGRSRRGDIGHRASICFFAGERSPASARPIDKAVDEHLLSDVPVASFLSGGIDSSIVTAVAAQKLEKKLQTFSVGFDIANSTKRRLRRRSQNVIGRNIIGFNFRKRK